MNCSFRGKCCYNSSISVSAASNFFSEVKQTSRWSDLKFCFRKKIWIKWLWSIPDRENVTKISQTLVCLLQVERGEFKNRQFDASTCSSCRRFLATPAPTVQPALQCVFPNATPGNRDLRQTHNLSVSVLSCFGVCFFFVISLTQSHNCFFFSACLQCSLPSVHCILLPQ